MSILNVNSANGAGMAFSVLKGSSAYEVAVKNGFEGTEQEWLASLGNHQPLILESEGSEGYEHQTTYGDRALQAIQEGRQILVRVPNASGDNYVATYSPVLMYQLPNQQNNYLYLFYFKDEKQDFSGIVGLPEGTVEMPQYGELKMLLSKNYDESPLSPPYFNNGPTINNSSNRKPVFFISADAYNSEPRPWGSIGYYDNPTRFATVDEMVDAYMAGNAYLMSYDGIPYAITGFDIWYENDDGKVTVESSNSGANNAYIYGSTFDQLKAAFAKYLP